MDPVIQVQSLSEQHQFILACIGHGVTLLSTLLLYHSTPKKKTPPEDPPK